MAVEMPDIPMPDIPTAEASCKPARCAMCPSYGENRCSGCNAIFYCSRKCQKEDLPIHRLICSTYQDFMSTRPGSNYHSAIVCLPDEDKPRFVWLRDTPGSIHPGYEQLSELGLDHTWIKNVGHVESANNWSLKRHIEPHHVMVSSQQVKSMPNGPNKSLSNICEDFARVFRGAVFIWATHCGSDRVKLASDLDIGPMALRHAVDELKRGFLTVKGLHEIVTESSNDNIKAVRLNCDGDCHILGRPTIEAVLEPISILNTDSKIATPVADRVGLPLIVRKVPPSIMWRNRHLTSRMNNQQACMLNPPLLLADTGSLIVARKDGKPLHPEHLLALNGYIAEKLVSPDHTKNACVTHDMLLAHRVDQTSRKNFKRWYIHEWRKHQTSNKKIPSPYDTQGLQSFRGMPTSISYSCSCCKPQA